MTTTPSISTTMFKICLFTIIFQVILWLASANNNLRQPERILNSKTISQANCTYPVGSTCKCPYTCYEQVKNTKYCIAKKCYMYDENLGTCKETGKDHVGPLVLQAIPVTGIFGAGFGNMGRWDIFGIYMAALFGGCCYVLITSVVCACLCNNAEEDITNNTEAVHCWSYCNGCLWTIGILVLYILGIVWTATPGMILDTNGCPLVFGS